MAEFARLTELRRREIEQEARHIQIELWDRRKSLWSREVPQHPIDVLDPGVALEARGYTINSVVSAGESWEQGQRFTVAGTIDPQLREVTIVSNLAKEVQLFTAAHELGHAILHKGRGTLHRDRAINSPTVRKDTLEIEADYFASCFLMPQKQLMQEFKRNFLDDSFELTDATAFALCTTSYQNARKHLRSPRDVAYALATAISYGGRPVNALTSTFEVSPTAMAIRLNELDLVGNGVRSTFGAC